MHDEDPDKSLIILSKAFQRCQSYYLLSLILFSLPFPELVAVSSPTAETDLANRVAGKIFFKKKKCPKKDLNEKIKNISSNDMKENSKKEGHKQITITWRQGWLVADKISIKKSQNV